MDHETTRPAPRAAETDGAATAAGVFAAGFTVGMGGAVVPAVAGWLQEAAAAHARALGFSSRRMHEAGVAWVLARLALRMDAYPPADARITVRTWPAVLEGLRAVRDFRIFDAAGAQIGAATSVWVALDMVRRRAVALPEFVTACHPATGERALELTGRSLPAPPGPGQGHPQCAILSRRADLDENGHVNNVHLLEWALEPVPEALPGLTGAACLRPRMVDIAFRAECRHPEAVTATCAPGAAAPLGGPALLHGLTTAGGTELLRLRSLWPGG
jgi:acyl-CoA thioesterase FadM